MYLTDCLEEVEVHREAEEHQLSLQYPTRHVAAGGIGIGRLKGNRSIRGSREGEKSS